jgi:cytochrome c553
MKAKKILIIGLVLALLSMLILLGCRGRQAAMRGEYVPYTEEEIRGLIVYQSCTSLCHQCTRPRTPRAYTRAQWREIIAQLHPSPGPGAAIVLDLSEEDMRALRAYCMAEARDAPVVKRPQLRFRTKDRQSPLRAP